MRAYLVISLLLAGCSASSTLGAPCATFEDCRSSTCVAGRCHASCNLLDPERCPRNSRCIVVPGEDSYVAFCSLADEDACTDAEACGGDPFVECRRGRCVTSCAEVTLCVTGRCDTTGAQPVCLEPISVGGADASTLDASW